MIKISMFSRSGWSTMETHIHAISTHNSPSLPVLNVGAFGKTFREARGDPGGGWCMDNGSLKSHSTTDPSSYRVNAQKRERGALLRTS